MSEREALLDAIRANPADDTPRLVLADWLDDHGEADHAAFLRIACAVRGAEREPDVLRPLAATLRRLAVRVPADFAETVCGCDPAALIGPWVDPDHIDNYGPLHQRHRPGPPVVEPADAVDTNVAYWQSGTHPDIVDRVWDRLGRELCPASRCRINGNPCLVHPWIGVILAVCYGTSYALRVPPEHAAAIPPDGRERVIVFSVGGPRDIQRQFGPDWLFGTFAANEINLLREVFDRYDPARNID